MIKQKAFIGENKMLKGALHIHTTRSDGHVSPEDTIRFYHDKGYDFLALTDHRIYNYKNFAPEVPITIIPGMEFDDCFQKDHGFRCFHTVCLGPSIEDGNGFKQDERLESGTATTQEEYQSYLDDFHAKNNLTIYCHPQWSSTPARYFEKMKGNFAMEIWNTSCVYHCGVDNDAAYWDELLGQGIRIFGVASDDTHNTDTAAGGWVMVQAENNVNAILAALKDGAFYSSCGPKIYDFRVENNRAIIECSAAEMVRFQSDMHVAMQVRSKDGSMTRAEMPLPTDDMKYRYVRAVVIDKDGKFAWTNPIFLDDSEAKY